MTIQLLCQLRYKAQILKTVPNTKRGSDNDPTQARINQFDKHVETLEEQYIGKEINAPEML